MVFLGPLSRVPSSGAAPSPLPPHGVTGTIQGDPGGPAGATIHPSSPPPAPHTPQTPTEDPGEAPADSRKPGCCPQGPRGLGPDFRTLQSGPRALRVAHGSARPEHRGR